MLETGKHSFSKWVHKPSLTLIIHLTIYLCHRKMSKTQCKSVSSWFCVQLLQGNKGSFSAVGIAELSCGRWHHYRPLRGDADVHKGLSRQREQHQLKFCLELLEIVRSPAQLTICTMLRKKKKMRKVGKRV